MADNLKHIAFILDGNRRWAKKNKLSQVAGHKYGYERAVNLIEYAKKYGIKYITYYMFSMENWNRSVGEISYLMNLFRNMFTANIDFFKNNDVKIVCIGNLAKLPDDIVNKLKILEEQTKNNKGITVVAAISYSGRDEIVRATQRIATDIIAGVININDITEKTFVDYLDTKNIPDPDVIVRTKEHRLSNFLLWQLAYSEIIFIDKFWPEFDEDDLKYVMEEFLKRSRSYGR